MILEEIAIGETEKTKRKAVQKNLGKEVVLKDWHNSWCHGIILKKDYDSNSYQMIIQDGRGQRRLCYHDLNCFLVVKKG